MRNLVIPFLLTLFFFSCKDDDAPKAHEIPDCIQEKIDMDVASPNPALKAVYWLNSIEGGHYWFHTEAVHVDGVEFILSAQCDTVCYYCGECVPPACLDIFPEYSSNDWELVWEK